jgi:hypothetical protein
MLYYSVKRRPTGQAPYRSTPYLPCNYSIQLSRS